ncbi:MAG TPA: cyclase family protein [Vicinamibacterales bacterium]|jgi:arylformamidase|nr:cyclase family protein [Vicinamibacterales bacterium]
MPLLDVSLPLDARLPIWPSNPPFDLTPVKQIAAGASSNVSRLTLGTHTGTHIDAPRHMIDGAPTLDQVPIDALIGPARVVAVDTDRAIEPRHVDGDALQGSTRILFKTRNSTFWGTPQFRSDFVFLTEEAARALVDAGVQLVGIDYLSIEEYRKPGAPAHKALLSSGVVIVEGLDLSSAEPGPYEVICLPVRVMGADGAPARVILRRES